MTKMKDILPIPRDKGYLELYQETADRLNASKVLPFRGRIYTSGIVQSHVYNKINDPEVQRVLNQIANEWFNS